MKTYIEFITEAAVLGKVKSSASLDDFISALSNHYGGWVDNKGNYIVVGEMQHDNAAEEMFGSEAVQEHSGYKAAFDRGFIRVVSNRAKSPHMGIEFSWKKHTPSTIKTFSKVIDAIVTISQTKKHKTNGLFVYFERVDKDVVPRPIGTGSNIPGGSKPSIEAVWKKIRGQL